MEIGLKIFKIIACTGLIWFAIQTGVKKMAMKFGFP